MPYRTERSRRAFLKATIAAGAGIALGPGCVKQRREDARLLGHIGVCTAIGNHAVAVRGGCSYVEESVRRFLIPDKPREYFEPKLAVLQGASCPVYACNSFLPGSLKSVGPEADHDGVLAFAKTAFERAEEAGVRTIVFGSGGSRKIPEGFAKGDAETQFTELLTRMAPIAARYSVVVVVEPLNRGETNFINSVDEGAEIVRAVGHPNVRLLADIYHMLREDESPEEIVKAGAPLYHCHIAEKETRTPPGVAGDDFTPYLRALKKAHYTGRMSIECTWEDFEKQLPAAVTALRLQLAAL